MPRCYTCSRRSRTRTDHSPPLIQLCLGGSQDNQLCILRPSKSLSQSHFSPSIAASQEDGPLNPPFITSIPDELLNEIFIHAVRSEVGQTGVFHTALALCTVSRRFHRIVQPHLYRNLNLSHHSLARPCRVVKLVLRTLKENPVLGHVVTTICVHIEYLRTDTFPGDFEIGIELLSLVPNVEVFQIQGGYEFSSTWPMIQNAVKHWRRIRHVRLTREDFSLHIPPVLELIMETPSLITLELHGVGEERGGTPRAAWNPPPKELERTSAITTLIIHNFSSTPSALHNLLVLPKALSHFTFGKIHYSPATWSLTQFQTLLAPHQETLTHIEIGSLCAGYTPINFSSFPRLEVLRLSNWVYSATAEEAAFSLLAPRLHTFIWDFRVIDQHTESWDDFSTPQKEWVVRFAELAAERKSGLRRIKIVFCPDEYYGPKTREELEVCVTPWDLMDEARQKMEGLGIELTWNKCWSREKCLERFIREEEYRDEGVESGHEVSSLSANEENY